MYGYLLLLLLLVIRCKQPDINVVNVQVHIRLGNLMQLQGRITIAIEEFQTALQIRKDIFESSDK